MLLEYKWIDFLQNSAEGKELAGFQSHCNKQLQTCQVLIDEQLRWVYLQGQPTPYIGVNLPYFLGNRDGHTAHGEVLETIPGEVLLEISIMRMG